jgi:hypothetical protein
MKKIMLFILVLILFSSGNAFAAFRCGPELVTRGDDKMEVLLKCGEPSFSELTSLESGRRYGEDLTYGSSSRRTTYFVETWFYNCRGANYRIEKPEPLPPAHETRDPAYFNDPRYGRVSVFGYPHSSMVYLDQEYVGEVPFTLNNIRPGPHTLVIRKEAYKDWTKQVMVKPGETLYLEVYLDKDW